MKNYMTLTLIAIFGFSFNLSAQLSVEEAYFEVKKVHSLKKLSERTDSLSTALKEQIPVLSKYKGLTIVESETYFIERTPLVGPYLDVNREDKTQYVNLPSEGWRLNKGGESLSIYGKHYRKNKEKKGSMYRELRLYKMATKKVSTPLAYAEFSYEKAMFPNDIINVQSVHGRSSEHYGYAALISERKEGLNKSIVIVNDDLELQGKYEYVAKNKYNKIHGVVKFDQGFQGLSYTNSKSLLKNEPDYEIVNFVGSEIIFTSMNFENWKENGANYYPGTINSVLVPKFDYLIELDNGDLIRIGYLDIEVPEGEGTRHMHQDIFLLHSDKNGIVKKMKFYNNPDQKETSSTFYEVTRTHILYGIRHVGTSGMDKLLVINKEDGTVEEYAPKGATKDYFWHYDEKDNSVKYLGVMQDKGQLLYVTLGL